MDTIATLMMMIGLLAIPVSIIMFIVSLVKKSEKKIPLIVFVGGIALLIIGSFLQPSPAETNTTEIQETTTSNVAAAIIKDSTLQYPASNENFKYNIYDKYIEITEYIGSQDVSSIIVPTTIDNLPVYVVDSFVFDKCTVPTIIFEEGIYDIKSGFSSSLKSVTLPSTLCYVSYGMFKNCYGLENIVLPEGIDSIQSNAFEGCSNLKEITIPSTVTKLSSELFSYCLNLETINLQNGLKEIEKYAFTGCKNLKSLTIPNTVEKIGIYAFNNTGLTSIEIPASVTEIGACAFWLCDSLTEVKFHNSDFTINATQYYIDGNPMGTTKNLFGKGDNTSSLLVYGKPGSTVAQVCADENIYFQPF